MTPYGDHIRLSVDRLVSATEPFVGFLYKNSSSKREFRENQLGDSSTLFREINKFLPTLSLFLDRFVAKFGTL
jgi:hypothetical protein